MKAFTWIAASAVLSISSTLYAGESSRVTVSHFEPLQRLSVTTQGSASSQKPGEARRSTLSFDAMGKTFDLQLEPNTTLIAAAPRNVLADGVAIYRGQLKDNTDSWARIVIFDGMPTGLIWDGDEMFAIEAPRDSSLQQSVAVIYRLADVFIEPGSVSCGTQMSSGSGTATYQKLIGELGGAIARAPGAVEEINLGAVGDFEFTNARGGDSAAVAAITARLNNVDGIFSQQLGVQLTIQTIDTFSSAADPFSDTGDASALLDELADYRQATPAQNSQGLTHLYTGRDLDTSTVGIAYSSALCSTRFGAGLSEGNGSATFDSLIAAHEIGHNFGAPHDGEAGSACEAEMGDFIMAPSLNGSNQFSACSITEMQDDVAAASCITAIPAVDMAIALNGQASTLLLGANTVLNYDLPNNGTLQATNVTADFTLPSTLTIESVTATLGTCTTAGGSVNCVLGVVPGSSDQTVTITTTPSSVGVGMLTANVTADVDERPGNNQEAIQVTVNPAVDLVVTAPAQASININEATTVSAMLENRSTLAASGVLLRITLNSGLRADSASWSLGSCTIAGQQIDCQTSNFTAQSSATLSMGVTGIASGSKNYTMTLSSNEADANIGDNSATGSVRVRDPKDDGGGAAGPMFLWALGLIALLARRGRRPLR
ncbi:MAG: M12 family metallo-peptidase [Gammaproteobacteria bacterium]|nr:M12 family metallo-peptidase [Gammaproteobacteria bacterium]MDH3373753.1 M12 family metallo-peptidase [Gammaproteobacteria bacterium]MDH3408815.1 M12 family metallo-peptidase [Gammaproteobacteria bacterium]